MKIRELEIGATARIVAYSTADRNYRQKLLRMGLVKNEIFTVVRKAPLGDPIEIKIKGYSLSLRKAEADALIVKYVK
ncbi:MAG: FeoA family protein [Candidatus Cloacimonadaceae bacterium]|jgi:ferrous iron transport protein A|nr:ferrous iron transport protein A [Candidatus Cloacimonadota bacterium]MDY0126901.1 FeoA family protein [Candidatus Cloacimonadaceae bacterium]MCB5255295.1 ferrous iron transport protein A [Candidatus Cloacimonadota bacterium]MCK9178730.1 ferrous iron transport protein A [Candidatus Cloacimonadota bacterium]MCK9242417.1 ferrous iron transport protein A [Candidatus Cloacimonadota bacterium]